MEELEEFLGDKKKAEIIRRIQTLEDNRAETYDLLNTDNPYRKTYTAEEKQYKRMLIEQTDAEIAQLKESIGIKTKKNASLFGLKGCDSVLNPHCWGVYPKVRLGDIGEGYFFKSTDAFLNDVTDTKQRNFLVKKFEQLAGSHSFSSKIYKRIKIDGVSYHYFKFGKWRIVGCAGKSEIPLILAMPKSRQDLTKKEIKFIKHRVYLCKS